VKEAGYSASFFDSKKSNKSVCIQIIYDIIYVYSHKQIYMRSEGVKSIVDILKALSDETRLRIINLLYEKELCVCDIMETLQITQTKASRHLAYLKNAGLVKDRKQAQWAYYSMVPEGSLKFLHCLVYDNLRCRELFNTDLASLKEWLDRKNITCD